MYALTGKQGRFGINADYRPHKNYQFQIPRPGDYGGITPEKARGRHPAKQQQLLAIGS
jgi:hypothetical protein